jgi:phenylalanyl-tRNA synthetase beta chain
MPTITVNRKVFEKLVGKKLPIEKLKRKISYLGTDLDEITDEEITVEIFPNRPDMLSVQGFARAFSSYIGKSVGLKEFKINKSNEKVIIDKSVKGVRPFTVCAIVKGITYDDEKIKEVIQIQEKLHVTYGRNRSKVAIGIYPFEKIKTPITFIAKKPNEIKFRPLESTKEMTAPQIIAHHQTGKDYGHLLEGKKTYPIFVDANGDILSMPPIVNSHTTGKINYDTKDVFIECSGFDFDVLEKCLNMIVTAMSEIGGKIYSMELEYPDKKRVTPQLKPTEMKVDIKYINKLLGLKLKENDFKKYIEMMGYGYKNKKVLIPSYRADIMHQSDLAEDIAIAYGYDKFEPTIPNVATIGEEAPFEVFKNKISNILVGLGLQEINTSNLTNETNQLTNMNVEMPLIELANSLSAEYDVLRAWVLPSMIETFKNNKHHDYPQKIFGIGTVFKKNTKPEFDTNIEENDRISVALTSEKADFTEIKQILAYLFTQIDCPFEIIETEHDSFIPGRVARVIVNNKKVAYIGEISPIVLENFSLEMPVCAFELNLTELFEILK